MPLRPPELLGEAVEAAAGAGVVLFLQMSSVILEGIARAARRRPIPRSRRRGRGRGRQKWSGKRRSTRHRQSCGER